MDAVSPVEANDGLVTAMTHEESVSAKRKVYVALLIYAALCGVLGYVLPLRPRLMAFLATIPIGIGIVHWCHVDAAERRFHISRLMHLGLCFQTAFIYPVYLFRTRGHAAWITLGWSLLLAVLMYGLFKSSQMLYLTWAGGSV